MNKRLFLSVVFIGTLVGVSPLLARASRAATNLRAEIRVAAIHAGLALEMHALPLTHLHLHHVINCLVGRHGRQFDPRAGNPCHGLGEGAIPDSRMSPPTVRMALHDALDDALAGEQAKTLVRAHHMAFAARENLLRATQALPHHH